MQKKENKQWLWLGLNPVNRQIVAFDVGSRSSKDALLFYNQIPAVFKGDTGFSRIIGKHRQKFLSIIIISQLGKIVDSLLI